MWERLSALEGGTVSGLTVIRDDRSHAVAMAVTPTGLFRSEDGGRSWAAMGRERSLPLAQQVVASPGFGQDGTLFSAAHDGLYRSEAFPGLCLDPAALLRGDRQGVKAAVAAGVATPEHDEFVRGLAVAGAREP